MSTLPMFSAEQDQQYFLELLNSDLAQLALGYEAFEAQVEIAVFALFLHEIEQGATLRGDQVQIDGVPYRLKLDELGADRCLRLHLFPVGVPKPQLEHSALSIEHFGRVRTIDIEWPASILRRHQALPDRLRQRILSFYTMLQELLTSKYSQLTDSALQSLYVVLNIHCEGKSQLVERAWFTVTDARTAKFQYFFDRVRVTQAIKILVEAQFYEFSPFELVVCLLADEATDTFWHLRQNFDYKSAFASLHFSELTSQITESTHWQAEKALYQEADLAAREICQCAGESLLINCPLEIAADMEEIVTRAKPMLTAQFANILKPYRAFRESVASVAARVHKVSEHGGLRDFASDVIAKLGKELLKPGQ